MLRLTSRFSCDVMAADSAVAPGIARCDAILCGLVFRVVSLVSSPSGSRREARLHPQNSYYKCSYELERGAPHQAPYYSLFVQRSFSEIGAKLLFTDLWPQGLTRKSGS